MEKDLYKIPKGRKQDDIRKRAERSGDGKSA